MHFLDAVIPFQSDPSFLGLFRIAGQVHLIQGEVDQDRAADQGSEDQGSQRSKTPLLILPRMGTNGFIPFSPAFESFLPPIDPNDKCISTVPKILESPGNEGLQGDWRTRAQVRGIIPTISR